MFNNLGYFIKESFRNIFTNRLMSFASVGVLVSCLIIMGTCTLALFNVQKNLEQIQDLNEITLFIDDAYADDENIARITSELEGLNNVKDCEYISREDGYRILQEMFAETPDALLGYDSSYVRISYKLTLVDTAKTDETMYQLNNIEGIDTIRYNDEVAAGFLNLEKVLTVASFWFIGILFIISIFIISNTIKLAVYSRRREINIMKYVGATDWFIRWPFIFEGLIIGLFSGIVAYFIQWYIYEYIIVGLFATLKNLIIIVDFSTISSSIGLVFAVAGIVIGVFGSSLSIRKHLDV